MISPSAPSSVIGVDVGSKWLDVATEDLYRRFRNDSTGWADVVELARDSVLVCEATGVYFRGLALAAVDAGIPVRVVNPSQVRGFAVARLSRTKTDKVDAALIREFGERMLSDLPRWWPAPEGLYTVMSLVRLGDGLMRHRVAAGNRTHALSKVHERVAEVSLGVKERMVEERRRVMTAALIAAREDELVRVWLEALVALPGLGEVSSLRLLAYSGDLRRFGTARRFASYTGLTPGFHQSGEAGEVGRMTRVGPRSLRSVLYWAAVAASRSKSDAGLQYKALVDRGKPGKVALVAVANRLARAAWTVCVK